MDTNQIVYISIEKIYPHPDNPRNDLGDLTELVESIKARGVLQNLTVVPNRPGYCVSCGLHNAGVGKCTEGHDIKGNHPPCPEWKSNGTYTVVIGHRRLAAAKLAGLTEVPCVISDMDYREQIGAMLLENIQRNDLTVIEQAQGFQLMMDLGETIASISEKTGFSDRTIQRRLNLMKLDQQKLQESIVRGGTLSDYMELEKIEDINLRNKVLEDIGTSNFRWALQQALEKEKRAKNLQLLLPKIEAFATKIDNTSGLRFVQQIFAKDHEDFEVPEDADTEEYFFTVNEDFGYVVLYQKFLDYANRTDATPNPEIERRNKNRAILEEATKTAYQLRHDFILGISNATAKKNIGIVIEFALKAMLDGGYSSFDLLDFAEIFDIKADDEEELTFKDVLSQIQKQPERSLLIAAYSKLDSSSNRYYGWDNRYHADDELDAVYEYLGKLGYEPSDEENALRNGTHECFEPVPETAQPHDDVIEAVKEHICQNPAVIAAYDEINSGGDDGEDSEEDPETDGGAE